jgi:competence protein ComEA
MEPTDRRRSRFPYVAGAVLLALLSLRVLGGGGGGGDAPRVALDGAGAAPGPSRATASHDAARVWVHVAGAVRRPGLYRVAADARAGVAIDAAGGLSRRADARAVNLAAAVRDGQQIVVPERGERPAAAVPSDSPGTPASGRGGDGGQLSLSSATVEQLDGLDGIGPTLAQRIVQWRDAHGGFRSVDQLREVEGIGEKRFEALRARVQP